MSEQNNQSSEAIKETIEPVEAEEQAEETVEVNESESKEESAEVIVATLTEQINQLKNDVARAYADTENLKKRLNNEAEMQKKYRIQSFAIEILPVLDNLERALAKPAENDEAASIQKGMEMIYNQLKAALEKEGVTEVDCLNKEFDANTQQSLMMEKKDGVESNIVIDVLQKGYLLKDRLLRAALVKISE